MFAEKRIQIGRMRYLTTWSRNAISMAVFFTCSSIASLLKATFMWSAPRSRRRWLPWTRCTAGSLQVGLYFCPRGGGIFHEKGEFSFWIRKRKKPRLTKLNQTKIVAKFAKMSALCGGGWQYLFGVPKHVVRDDWPGNPPSKNPYTCERITKPLRCTWEAWWSCPTQHLFNYTTAFSCVLLFFFPFLSFPCHRCSPN